MRKTFEAAFQRLPAFMRNEMRIAFTRGWLTAQAHARAEMGAEIARLRDALKDARNFVKAELDVRKDSYTINGDWATLDETDGGACGEALCCLERIDNTLAEPQPTGAGE